MEEERLGQFWVSDFFSLLAGSIGRTMVGHECEVEGCGASGSVV